MGEVFPDDRNSRQFRFSGLIWYVQLAVEITIQFSWRPKAPYKYFLVVD
jgi:hypothetical protein